jgi:SAM-dependent methyltransferase
VTGAGTDSGVPGGVERARDKGGASGAAEGAAEGARGAAHWDAQFTVGRPWGDEPSVLARAAVRFLSAQVAHPRALHVLDLGCGEGRDARYLWHHLGCAVLGVDTSAPAVALARQAAPPGAVLEFAQADLAGLDAGTFDVVCAANLYQILPPDLRAGLAATAARSLAAGGYLMIGTLAVGDPQHDGRGARVPGEENSYRDKVYLHLAARDELAQMFDFVDLRELEAVDYDEPRAGGDTHHHRSWVLIGRSRAGG